MLQRLVLVACLSALMASGLPLNINLGAYSPALVVGDGEISFGGNPESASQVLQTLASGAQNGATAGSDRKSIIEGALPVPALMPPTSSAPQANNLPAGDPSATGAISPSKSTVSIINTPATVDQSSGVVSEFISHKMDTDFDSARDIPNLAKRDISSLDLVRRDENTASEKMVNRATKRDLQGFRDALGFARDTMTTSPRIELGTDNSGVGILVDPRLKAPFRTPENGTPTPGAPRPVMRREISGPPADAAREKLGLTLIAIGAGL